MDEEATIMMNMKETYRRDLKVTKTKEEITLVKKLNDKQFSKILDDFEIMQKVLGYPKLTKKDEVVLRHFTNHLVVNKMLCSEENNEK